MLIKTDNYHDNFPDPFESFESIEKTIKEERKIKFAKKRKVLEIIAFISGIIY